MADEEKDAPELQVAKLFQLAGHEVTQAVGAEPGTVDWFATPKEGFVRPRTYFRAWKTCPERLDEALAELEQARVARGADRALGVVMEGRLPKGHGGESDEIRRLVSYRRFALEVSGISARIAEQAAHYAARGGPERYIPRRGRLGWDKPGDAGSLLKEWAEQGDADLALWGDFHSEHLAVIRHAAYQLALEFARDPENVTPLVSASRPSVAIRSGSSACS